MTGSFIHFEGGGGIEPAPPGVFSGTLIARMGREMPGQANLETILRTGQIVAGQYRVDRLIAKGGMAAVWAGVNEHTGKRVALKVILQSFVSNGEVAELFRREALAASKVNHPSVVNIFDVIDHEGMTCIVMELLDGETLGGYLARNGAISLEATMALLLPAMRGVAAANAQGVVHRDLKPGNIFLCSGPDGHLLTTKVLDFGISVIMRQVGETAPVTELLAMFGTPAYMAPEAIEFSPNIDGRADVYGFGVLFFEALTGKLPFMGPPGLDLLKRILTEPAPMVTLYRPDLPSDVVNLVACALAKNPADRFPDMEHLIHATEDRLLPLLPTPRSLTPISGIFSLPLAKSNSELSIPIVQAVFEEEPSAGASKSSETRALYSMASEPLHAAHEAGLAQRRKSSPANAGTQTRRKHVSLAGSRRFPNRRVAIGAALVAFLIVTAWVSAPASSRGSGVEQGQASSSSEIAVTEREPVVTPLPSIPSPAPLPAVAADQPSDSVADSESLQAIGQLEPTPTSFRTATRHPSKHVSRGGSTKRQPRTADFQNQPSAPRAGRLSPSDF
jgi:serine/threonine-protein kinase